MSASSFSGFPADARILGLDIGSISVDMVLLDGLGTPLYSRYVRHHGQPDKVLCAELEALERTHAGIAAAVTGTGADRVARLLGACAVNEVIAQVAAASFRYPQARSVIDIGGQDAKVIALSPSGKMVNFVMNDKCAAGTGRFLDVMASILRLDVDDLDAEAAKAAAPAAISSTCTVFAESEVISQLANGVKRPDLVAGICRSVASRVAALARRAGVTEQVCLSGGVARNGAVRRGLEECLNVSIAYDPRCQHFGAIGAALWAYKQTT